MTSRPVPQCVCCQFWVSPLDVGDGTGTEQICTAFPSGIPDDVWWNQRDHRQPYPNDGGVRFKARPGMEYPTYALARTRP